AAVVIASSPKDQHAPAQAPTAIIDTHSLVIEGSDKAMTWEVGDNGFMMELSAEVPALIERALPPWIDACLAAHGLCRGSIAAWAIHPGGPRVIDSVVNALGLPADAGDVSRSVLRDFGNMSSATLLFILERLVRSGAAGPVVALAFGPGLSAEMLLVSASTRSQKNA
ncbi:MAG: type III polyketide synthase, partial [Phycisphaerae bacterium]|nr:type III polyketide synthase [Phycisphaerae bacterium]